jgi:hypothetical protein
MNTAVAQKNATVGSKGNSSQSSQFIAPKQAKKKSEKKTDEKKNELFIAPTRQESNKENIATENTSPIIPTSKGIVEEKEEIQSVEAQQSDVQETPTLAKETASNTATAKENTGTPEGNQADEAKTPQKGKAKGSGGGGGGGGDGKAYNVPDAPKNGAAEKEKVKEEDAPLTLPTENSKVYADGLASQTPTNFIRGVKQSSTTLTEVQGNEQKTLTESLPEIEQPTGIPTKSTVQKEKAKAESEKVGETIKGDKSILPDLNPTGKKEGAQIETKSVQPPSSVLERIRSFFGLGRSGNDDDRKSQIKSGITKLPTSESVATSPGEKPKVDLTGQGDPNKNKENLDESTATTTKEQEKNLAESKLYKGENDIYPEMELEMMSPTVELSTPPNTAALAEEMPVVSAEVKSSFDANAQAHMDKELAPEMQKQDAEYTKMQTDQEKAHKKSETDIENETERVKKEQELAQGTAKSDVDSQRGEWQKENENVKKEYSEKSEAEKKKIDGEIDTKVKEADTKITKEYDTAQKEADKKVTETDREAERKKAQAKKDSENKSWWDRAVDAVSDFFDKLKEGLNKLFDGLRKLVKGLIEAAKKFANKLIDLARDAIVGMIKAFGEVLKGFVNIALAAFPKLRDKFNAAIDKAVNVAVDAVNAFAEGLKKAVNALLDLLGAALDAILAAYQAAFNFLLDVMKFLTVGLIKVLQFLWNLIEGAWNAPGQFFGALAEVALGGNPADPLKDFEVPIGQEENWAAAMGKNPGEQSASGNAATAAIPAELQNVLTKSQLSDDDVALEPMPAVTLEPELIAGLPTMKDGVPLELGGAGADAVTTQEFQASAADAAGYNLPQQVEQSVDESAGTTDQAVEEVAEKPSPDWVNMSDQDKLDHYNGQMLVESEAVGNAEPQPGKVASTPNMDNDPATLITKTGRLDVATRLAFMGRQMMTGLQVFWNKNKVWIIAALVTALLAAGLIAFFTGGAGLVVAVDIIVKAMIIIFGAYAVYQAMGHIWDYVKKAWAGDAVGAGKSLAMAMAVIVMEFLLDKILLGMGKVFKRIVAAAKTTRIGQKIVKGANLIRKGTTRVGNVVRKGISKVKGTRLVVYMRGVVGKGTKKLSNLRQKILAKFKFRRIWLEKSGRWIQLWGEFNAKVLLAQDDADGNRVVDVDSAKLRKDLDSRQIVGQKVDVNGQKGIVIADEGSKYSDEVAGMSKADQTTRHTELDELGDKARGDKIRGGTKSERVALNKEVKDSVFAKADSGRVDANGNKIYVDRRQKPPVDIPNYGTHYPDKTPAGLDHPKAGQPVPENLVGTPRADIGHVKGETWEKRLAAHKEAGHTREQIIKAEQNADLYILEERSSNRSRKLD